MRITCLLPGALMMLNLAACGGVEEAAPEKPPMTVSDTVLAPTVGTLDKARSVEGILQQERDSADAAVGAAE